jgi:hypothetical protein
MPWHPRQINNADGKGPTVPGEYLACPQATAPVRDFGEGSQFVCAFGNQLHFTYADPADNVQDCWYDDDANRRSPQQINNAHGIGPTVPGASVICAGDRRLRPRVPVRAWKPAAVHRRRLLRQPARHLVSRRRQPVEPAADQ